VSSKFRIAASRANGARSRGPVTDEGKRIAALNSIHSSGPVTPEGKFRAAQNAIRHGLLADSLVLEGESEDRFCALLAAFEAELQPESQIEHDQAEIMAVAHWRRMRLWSVEKAEYIEETRRRKAAANQAGPEIEDGETPITHLARTLADDSQVLHLLNRYETRFSREYTPDLACATAQRTLREQRERQAQRDQARQAKRNRNQPAEMGEIQ
jgi:hypothetical protein